MKLIFRLRFHTKVGQSLWLTGNHPLLGDGRADRALPLQYFNEEFWQATLNLPAGVIPDAAITYNYILRECGRLDRSGLGQRPRHQRCVVQAGRSLDH